MAQKMINKKHSKGFYITLWSFAFLLIIGGMVFATTILNDQSGTVSKTLINDSGMYYNDGSTYRGVSSGTADVVVCRGTSTADDIYKSVKWVSGCDVVCKSTDTSCGSKINAITSTGNIFISKGFYNIESQINLRSNMTFLFESGAIFNNTNPSFQIFRTVNTGVLKRNIIINGGEFNCQNTGCWYSTGNFTDLTIKNAIFNEVQTSIGIPIFFDAYAPYNNLVFQNNIVQGLSADYDMVGSGSIYYSDFSHNVFRNGNGQGIGVAGVYYTKFVNNYFENLGNPIGIEGGSNIGNLINNNIAYYTGNIKLGAYITDNSSFNIVSGNQIHFGGGIQWGNSWNNEIFGNTIYGSRLYGLYGLACDHCSIYLNKLINTNVINGVSTWNGSTAVTNPSIYLGNSSVIPSPMGNRIFDNSIYRTNLAFVSSNGTSYSNSYPGPIIIDLGVRETLAYNNFEDGNFGAGYYNVGSNSYLLDENYLSVAITSLSCATSKSIAEKTLHNSTTSCTCTGGAWKCWGMS